MNTLQLTLTKRYRYKSTDFFSYSAVTVAVVHFINARDSSKKVKNTVSMYAVQSNKNISVCISGFDHIQNMLCLGGVLNLLQDFVMIINYCMKISVIFFFAFFALSLYRSFSHTRSLLLVVSYSIFLSRSFLLALPYSLALSLSHSISLPSQTFLFTLDWTCDAILCVGDFSSFFLLPHFYYLITIQK